MRIIFNGREYDGVEQMPPEIRRTYLEVVGMVGDADGDGVPDVAQPPRAGPVAVKESIFYNGRQYNDRSELPPEVRQALEQLPPPKPADLTTRVTVTTKVLPPKITCSVREARDEAPSGPKPTLPWLALGLLAGITVVVLWLWFSGIRPGDLFGR
jgi:hypothetical protein